MKTIQHFLVIVMAGLIACAMVFSCSTTERAAVPCPEFSGRRFDQQKHGAGRIRKHTYAYQHTNRKGGNIPHQGKTSDMLLAAPHAGITDHPASAVLTGTESTRTENYERLQYLNGLTASIDKEHVTAGIALMFHNAHTTDDATDDVRFFGQPGACDTILLKAGDILTGKVLEIGLDEVKYKSCDNPEGPMISIRKSDIFVIKYPNGNRDYITATAPLPSPVGVDVRKTEGLGTAGFITSLAGLFVFGIPLGLVSLIFGGVSLGKFKRHPEKYKGKGLAIASVVIGLVDIIGVIILLSLE